MVVRRFWEPYHEARKLQKMAENARMDHEQLLEVFRTVKETASKVQVEGVW